LPQFDNVSLTVTDLKGENTPVFLTIAAFEMTIKKILISFLKWLQF
jgi:hypothetical protein